MKEVNKTEDIFELDFENVDFELEFDQEVVDLDFEDTDFEIEFDEDAISKNSEKFKQLRERKRNSDSELHN